MNQFKRLGIAAAAAAAMSFVSLHAAQYGGDAAARPAAQQQNVPTPRTRRRPSRPLRHVGRRRRWRRCREADEKGNLVQLTRGRGCSKQQFDLGNCAPGINFERDSGVTQRMGPEIPMYKPEFWDRVPVPRSQRHAGGSGIPLQAGRRARMGPPAKIVQTPTELIFLYGQGNTSASSRSTAVRTIRSSRRTRPGTATPSASGKATRCHRHRRLQRRELDRWPGWFHSNNMHVIEKLTRTGNTLRWDATVEDPDVLMQPYHVRRADAAAESEPEGDAHRGSAVRGARRQHMVTHERG
jgi:hypothetical protein